VEVEVDGRVGIITLNGPPVNALTVALVDELRVAQRELVVAGVSVAVIRSGVAGFFAAGADLKLLGLADVQTFGEYVDHLRSTIDHFADAAYIAIAAIDGHALGGGLELALACSLRVAGVGASLGVPEIKLGVIPGAGGTQRLARMLPRGKALDLVLTGRSVDADEACELGIVDRLASDGQTGADAALELARALADGPIEAYRSAVRCVDAARDLDFKAGMAIEREEVLRLFGSADGREGIAAFLEKRPAEFGK